MSISLYLMVDDTMAISDITSMPHISFCSRESCIAKSMSVLDITNNCWHQRWYSDICAGSVACCYVPCEFVSCVGRLACLHRIADNTNPAKHGVNLSFFLPAASSQTWEQTCRVPPTTRVKSMGGPSPGSINDPKMTKKVD